MKGVNTMSDMMGWTLVLVGFVIDYFMIKSAIKSYHDMKQAKAKAQIWDARIK